MRRTPHRALISVLLGAVAGSACAQGSAVQLRGGESPPPGLVTGCTPEGVVVASPLTGEVTIGWDRVRTVTGELAEAASQYRGVADRAWRAASRLERGDVPAAEPIFEGLFADYAGGTGPTSAAVCGGLLRCRLERGAHTLAVGAWLAWLHSGGENTASAEAQRDFDGLLLIDSETGLVPELPPIWLSLPAVRVFGQTPLRADRFGERVAQLAALYQHAAMTESDLTQPMPRLESNDPAVRLVWEVVAAQSDIDAERATGRRAIEKRLRAEPAGWTDAWLRTALGRSLLREPEPDDQRRGVIELLRVRVTHEHDAPYLAGLALAESAVTMRRLGDSHAADLLRRELLDRFPGHPATTWEPISLWQPATSANASSRPVPPSTTAGARSATGQSRSPHG